MFKLVIENLVNYYISIRIFRDDYSIINIFQCSRIFKVVNVIFYSDMMYIFQIKMTHSS